MPSQISKTLAEQAHDAMVAEIQTESPATLAVDASQERAEITVHTTKRGWTFTAYVKKLWKGAASAGLRVERPLSLLALIRKGDE